MAASTNQNLARRVSESSPITARQLQVLREAAEKVAALQRSLPTAAQRRHVPSEETRARFDIPGKEHRFERWRERTAHEIARLISGAEAQRFRSLRALGLRGNSVSLGKDIAEHAAWLYALAEEIRRTPERYPDPSTIAKPPAKSAASSAARSAAMPAPIQPPPAHPGPAIPNPPMPTKVTIGWLVTHVPIAVWGTAALILLGAFGLGIKLGQNDAFVRIVAPLLRIDVPVAPSAAHPPPPAGQPVVDGPTT